MFPSRAFAADPFGVALEALFFFGADVFIEFSPGFDFFVCFCVAAGPARTGTLIASVCSALDQFAVVGAFDVVDFKGNKWRG